MHHSGFVALIGRTNAGKSTFVNRAVGQKIAIVTDKPQTTRNALRGIVSRPDGQIVFVDTPGLHKPETALDEAMNRSAFHAMKESDTILWILDASVPSGSGDAFVASQIASLKEIPPLWLVLNKSDLVSEADKATLTARFQPLAPTARVRVVSSLTGEGVDALTSEVLASLPEGPSWFPDDIPTDQSESFLIAEYVREKILMLTQKEVPYATAVIVTGVEGTDDLMVSASILVERPSQKAILIGSQGAMIAKIRHASEHACRRFLGKKVSLDLFVRVEADWRNNPGKLVTLGYRR